MLEAYKTTPPGPERASMGVKLLKVKKELLETIDATRVCYLCIASDMLPYCVYAVLSAIVSYAIYLSHPLRVSLHVRDVGSTVKSAATPRLLRQVFQLDGCRDGVSRSVGGRGYNRSWLVQTGCESPPLAPGGSAAVLLESLRNAVQPPGSRTASLIDPFEGGPRFIIGRMHVRVASPAFERLLIEGNRARGRAATWASANSTSKVSSVPAWSGTQTWNTS